MLHDNGNFTDEIRQVLDRDDLPWLKELVERKGLNVNATDARKLSLLHHAAGTGSNNVAAYLIEKGANVNAQDEMGYTPLHYVALCNHDGAYPTAKLLIENGADQSIKTVDGDTALQIAERTKQMQLINNAHGRTNSINDIAALKRYEKMVELLGGEKATAQERLGRPRTGSHTEAAAIAPKQELRKE